VIKQALQARSADGRLLFDSVQATWNLLEQSASELCQQLTRTMSIYRRPAAAAA
jgi:hypothetical protein